MKKVIATDTAEVEPKSKAYLFEQELVYASTLVSSFVVSTDKPRFLEAQKKVFAGSPKFPTITKLLDAMQLLVDGKKDTQAFNEVVARLLQKGDLHCHMDGSLPKSVLNTPDLVSPGPHVDPLQLLTFEEFLEKAFADPLTMMQTPEQLSKAAYAVAIEAYKEGVIHAEFRYAPMLHLQPKTSEGEEASGSKPMAYEQIFNAVSKGFLQAIKETGMTICHVAAMYRNKEQESPHSVETAKALIEHAKEFYQSDSRFKNKLSFSLDVVGLEALPTSVPGHEGINAGLSIAQPYFKTAYGMIDEYNDSAPEHQRINKIAHAGEVPEVSGSNILTAVKDYKIFRLGHACALQEVWDQLTEEEQNSIVVEVCMKSNVHLKNRNNYEHHNIHWLIENGIPFALAPDNKTATNTSVSNEYLILLNFILEKSGKIPSRSFFDEQGKIHPIIKQIVKTSLAAGHHTTIAAKQTLITHSEAWAQLLERIVQPFIEPANAD